MVEVTFEQLWPHRVILSAHNTDYTATFAWLWAQILKDNLNGQEVFTTFGNRTVAFGEKHRKLAMHFKLRFG